MLLTLSFNLIKFYIDRRWVHETTQKFYRYYILNLPCIFFFFFHFSLYINVLPEEYVRGYYRSKVRSVDEFGICEFGIPNFQTQKNL